MANLYSFNYPVWQHIFSSYDLYMKEDLFNPVVLPGVLCAAVHGRGMESNHNDLDCGINFELSYYCLDMFLTHLGIYVHFSVFIV